MFYEKNFNQLFTHTTYIIISWVAHQRYANLLAKIQKQSGNSVLKYLPLGHAVLV